MGDSNYFHGILDSNTIRTVELRQGDEFIVNDKCLFEMFDVQGQIAKTSPIKFKLIEVYSFILSKPKTWKYLLQRYYKFRVVSNGGW